MSSWFQKRVSLHPRPRGCHVITREILASLSELKGYRVGWLQIFILHTSASLTINENADPDVPVDLAMSLDRVVPETWPYVHTIEGPDDMPAHVKSSLTSTSLLIPIQDGGLVLGTWQGIYLCEHRNLGGPREVVLTIQGEPFE